MAKLKKEIKVVIPIPEGINVEIDGSVVKAKGKAGENSRNFFRPLIKLSKEDNNIVIKAARSSKRELKIANSFGAHIRNMLKSADEGSKYILKICSGHFPMNVSVKGNELIVKNFFGEKIPRIIKLKEGANVKVEGDLIIVESPSKELSAQVAADIEKLTRRTKYDMRVFQDGIWITEKDGEKVR